jgi:hypothetical protein
MKPGYSKIGAMHQYEILRFAPYKYKIKFTFSKTILPNTYQILQGSQEH